MAEENDPTSRRANARTEIRGMGPTMPPTQMAVGQESGCNELGSLGVRSTRLDTAVDIIEGTPRTRASAKAVERRDDPLPAPYFWWTRLLADEKQGRSDVERPGRPLRSEPRLIICRQLLDQLFAYFLMTDFWYGVRPLGNEL